MARDFSSSNYIRTANAVVSGTPLSMACWFNVDDITTAHWLLVIAEEAVNGDYFGLKARGNTAGDPLQATARQDPNENSADSSTGFSSGTWHHACGVFTSSVSRAVYLDGGSKGTNTTNRTPASLGSTAIGTKSLAEAGSFRTDGRIAEAAIWNASLTDDEAATLAEGVSPLMVRPGSLVAYWPIIGRTSPEVDLVGGYTLTVTGTPSVAAHPRIAYVSYPTITTAGSGAAPGAGVPPIAMAQYRRRRVV